MNWLGVRRRLHVSWWIATASIAFVAGVASAKYIPASLFSSYIWLIVGISLICLVVWRRYIYLFPAIIIAGALVGLWRGSVQVNQLTDLSNMVGFHVTISGRMREDIDTNSAGETVMRIDQLYREGTPIQGSIWANAVTTVDIKRGDRVTVTGTLSEGFGSFSASIYRAVVVKVERPQPGDVARQARDWFAEKVNMAIPSPESSLGLGYLVGQKRALPAELTEALQIVGLTHVVVASGYNLTILVRLARRLFEKISKYMAALSATTMIVFFIAITGLSPSMSRAGLVAGLSLAAWYYGRRFNPIVLLAFAAAVTVLVNPSFAWGDLGWELSFLAFAGVMILAPLLQRYFFGDKKPSTIRQIIGETVAAIVVTAPLLIYTFSQFSNVALIANILVLPLVPLAMLLTCIAGVGAFTFPAIAPFIGMPAMWLLQYMISVAQYLAALPWAVSTVQMPIAGVIVSYLTLIGVCFYLQRVTKFDLKTVNIVE